MSIRILEHAGSQSPLWAYASSSGAASYWSHNRSDHCTQCWSVSPLVSVSQHCRSLASTDSAAMRLLWQANWILKGNKIKRTHNAACSRRNYAPKFPADAGAEACKGHSYSRQRWSLPFNVLDPQNHVLNLHCQTNRRLPRAFMT